MTIEGVKPQGYSYFYRLGRYEQRYWQVLQMYAYIVAIGWVAGVCIWVKPRSTCCKYTKNTFCMTATYMSRNTEHITHRATSAWSWRFSCRNLEKKKKLLLHVLQEFARFELQQHTVEFMTCYRL